MTPADYSKNNGESYIFDVGVIGMGAKSAVEGILTHIQKEK